MFWLRLDYILHRASVVSAALARVAQAVVRPIGLSRAQMPYWLGQTFIAARRASVLLMPLLPELTTL